MLLNRTGGGGENVTPQLDEQESIIEQIQAILPYKGASEVDCGEVILDADTSSITVTHKLNAVPSNAWLVRTPYASNSGYSATNIDGNIIFTTTAGVTTFGFSAVTKNTTTVKFSCSGTALFKAGTFRWVVIK